MIVYHGSNQEIKKPDCVHSRKRVDFGAGFYVTPLKGQATLWSEKFNLYFDGLIGKDEALGRLKYFGPSYQICIKHQEILDKFLTFTRSDSL